MVNTEKIETDPLQKQKEIHIDTHKYPYKYTQVYTNTDRHITPAYTCTNTD